MKMKMKMKVDWVLTLFVLYTETHQDALTLTEILAYTLHRPGNAKIRSPRNVTFVTRWHEMLPKLKVPTLNIYLQSLWEDKEPSVSILSSSQNLSIHSRLQSTQWHVPEDWGQRRNFPHIPEVQCRICIGIPFPFRKLLGGNYVEKRRRLIPNMETSPLKAPQEKPVAVCTAKHCLTPGTQNSFSDPEANSRISLSKTLASCPNTHTQ